MRKGIRGFTIVELLVVIVVIAILAAVTIVAYNGIQSRARDTQRDSAVSVVRRGLDLYRIDNGGYPTPCANVNADCPVSDLASYLAPYMNTMPVPASLSGQRAMFFNNGGTTSYTILVFYESKPTCKQGVNPMSSYYSQYPICS